MNEYTLLEAMNGIREETVLRTRQLLENKEEHRVRKVKNVWRTILIAAVIASLLSVTAYAISQFSMKGHPGEGQVFTSNFGDISIEYTGQYVFEFEGPEECREVRFKTNWLPDEEYWEFVGPDEDGWATLLEAREIYNEEFGVFMPSCVIDVLYAPQFVDGGAMILKDFTPEEITEETWGEVLAYKFAAVAGHAIDAEQTMFPTGNFVILFHPEQGWIIGVRGYDSMENIERIARGLEVEQLDSLVNRADFENYVEWCDIYIG